MIADDHGETLADELRQRLETLKRIDPDRPLKFIVTLRPSGQVGHVVAAGMAVDRHIIRPPLLLGTMTPEVALNLARLDDVLRIEYDAGGVRGLG